MATTEQSVTVDDQGNIRLLPPDDLQKVNELSDTCDKFVKGRC